MTSPMTGAVQSCWDSGLFLVGVGVVRDDGQKIDSDHCFQKRSCP